MKVKQKIYEQKYLELLEKRLISEALVCLRTELIPCFQLEDSTEAKEKCKLLSSIIMIKSQEEINKLTNWDGAEGNSRRKLLDLLQSFISPKKMLETGKLESLLRQSVAYQINT